jgi:NAD(P)-dependent dehydrogenase (short-subunit alcohol dehydrogenase family)
MTVALVTGPTSGIGRAVSRRLAEEGIHVIAAGRSVARLDDVVGEIGRTGGSAEPLVVDLSSFASIRQAAGKLEGRSIDLLIDNAGVAVARGTTFDGFEIQFGVNHLGHFLLTNLLCPALPQGARVVIVSSDMHRRARGIDFDRVTGPTRSMFGVPEYATSKLANILFARELARVRPQWRTYAVHPGLVDTHLFPALTRPLVRRTAISPDEGADTIVWCATEPSLERHTGRYYARRQEVSPSALAMDDGLARELWARSHAWCGLGETGVDG